MVTYFFRQLLFKKTSRNALLLSFLITLQVPAAYAGGKSEEEKEGRDRDRASESSQELPPSQGSYRSYLAPAATALSALAAIIYGRGLNIIGLLRSTQPARAVAAEVGEGVDVSTQSEGVGGEGAPMDGPEHRPGESRASTRERFLKAERDEARRQCAEARRQRDEARRQCDEARRQCDELTGERDTIQDECEGLRSSQLALQQQIRQLEQELLEKINQLAARGDCIDYLAEELGEDAELLRALRLEVQQGHEALARSGEALDQTRRIATERIEVGQRELAEIQQKLQAARDALVKTDAAVVQCKAVRAAGRGQRSGLGAGRGRPPLAQQGATGGRGGHGPADALRLSAVLL